MTINEIKAIVATIKRTSNVAGDGITNRVSQDACLMSGNGIHTSMQTYVGVFSQIWKSPHVIAVPKVVALVVVTKLCEEFRPRRYLMYVYSYDTDKLFRRFVVIMHNYSLLTDI